MWYILKYKNNCLNEMILSLEKKIGFKLKVFTPFIKIKKKTKYKNLIKKKNILENYTFVYNEKFLNSEFIQFLKFTKGLKYFLEDAFLNQENIKDFIEACKKHTDSDGYILPSFYELKIGEKYKFIDGPFINKIFKLENINEKKLEVLLGNCRAKVLNKYSLVKTV